MRCRRSSEHGHGLFASVDGPSGAGKSTIVQHLAQLLVAEGKDVHVTAEPSDGPIGTLARELTESVTGYALACLYASDRYYHVVSEIEPNLRAGRTVISEGFIPSGLAMQRFDGIDLQTSTSTIVELKPSRMRMTARPSSSGHVGAGAMRPVAVMAFVTSSEATSSASSTRAASLALVSSLRT